jgi:hypothetical protein
MGGLKIIYVSHSKHMMGEIIKGTASAPDIDAYYKPCLPKLVLECPDFDVI